VVVVSVAADSVAGAAVGSATGAARFLRTSVISTPISRPPRATPGEQGARHRPGRRRSGRGAVGGTALAAPLAKGSPRMFEFFQQVAAIAVPVFVIAIMLNVGLTQRASRILECLKGWPFVLRMLVANFVAAPVAMILIVRVLDLAPAFEAGLLVYSLSAGAPFLIKLTEAAEH